MPSYLASIEVMLKPLVNDPQGLAVLDSLNNLGFVAAQRVRVGKRIEVADALTGAPSARANADAYMKLSIPAHTCRMLHIYPLVQDK